MTTTKEPIPFDLGQIVATPGSLELLEQHGKTAMEFIKRHARNDWGDLEPYDRDLNDKSVEAERDGTHTDKLLSSYNLPGGDKVWVITEWDRSVTTVLLPSEY